MRRIRAVADARGILGQLARIRERANSLTEEELERRAITGIMHAHGSVLNFLFQQSEPVLIKEVVARVGRVKSTVTGMIKTLEHHGYVRKTPSPQDGRAAYVELTKKGWDLRGDFDAISEKLQKTLYGSMPTSERQDLVRLLSTIEDNLNDS
jgi:DNA-binding MarR family transcriptional regulator